MNRERDDAETESGPENTENLGNPRGLDVPRNPGDPINPVNLTNPMNHPVDAVNSRRSRNGELAVPLVTNGDDSRVLDQDERHSHQDDYPSDSDPQDEDSGDDSVYPHTRPTNSRYPPNAGSVQTDPLASLQNFLSFNSHLLNSIPGLQSDGAIPDGLDRNGLEALQAAINSGSFTLPPLGSYTSPAIAAFLPQPHMTNNHLQTTSSRSQIISPTNTRHSVSPAGSVSGGEIRDTNTSTAALRGESSVATQNNIAGPSHQSGSSHQAGPSHHQQNWSYEEQFKQLYEISDDSERKDFLNDLFSYMQQIGHPINRLPIMAKNVLDLYELYKLVVQRGGLVEVINKKLWQEVIKGLRLPSSITSAAFTLRTQYRRYLYEYECYKENLSTPAELHTAIEGNRRESRSKTSNLPNPSDTRYLQHPITLSQQMSHPLINPPGHHQNIQLNGGTAHSLLPHPLPQGNPQHPLGQAHSSIQGPTPGMAPVPASSELQLVQCLQMMQNLPTREVLDAGTPSPLMLRQGRPRRLPSPLSSRSPVRTARSPLQRSHSPVQRSRTPLPRSGSPEPQALDLGVRASSTRSSPAVRSPQALSGAIVRVNNPRNQRLMGTPVPSSSSARTSSDEESPRNYITIRCDSAMRNNISSVKVYANFDGVPYEGVLLPRNDDDDESSIAINNNNNNTNNNSNNNNHNHSNSNNNINNTL